MSGDWFQAWAGTVEKPNNDLLVTTSGNLVERNNEDRFRLSCTADGGIVAGVSDGAGGQGLYCGDWAERLLTRLPQSPIDTDTQLNEWLDSFWEEFQQEFKERARIDPFLFRKFVKEGSYATLAAMWLRPDVNGIKLNALLYGDSALFVWRLADGRPALRIAYPDKATTFLHDPYLLNWQAAAKSEKLEVLVDFAVAPGDTIVMASDGMGQYLLLRSLYGTPLAEQSEIASQLAQEVEEIRVSHPNKLAVLARAHAQDHGPSFAEEFSVIRQGFGDVEAFAKFIGQRFQKGLLPNDDCTLVIVNIGTDPVTGFPLTGRSTERRSISIGKPKMVGER